MDLDAKLKLSDLVKSKNIAEMLSDEDKKTISNRVYDDWSIDKDSRYDWEEKTATAMKLALQVVENKTFPWPNASNVKFPIITVAALQFQSRAYPALIPGTDVVKARVFGPDPDGQKTARANRVSSYMSFQLLEEDTAWESSLDEALISMSIVGCAFKKTYFDSTLRHNVSAHVLAKDLYIPYFADSLETASRITHMLYVNKNDLISRQRAGLYCEFEYRKPYQTDKDTLQEAADESSGLEAPMEDASAPRELLEQHRWLDLDGDGYDEPYIVTIDKETKHLCRIVARWHTSGVRRNIHKEVLSISPIHYFTKYTFIPSPDGGIYDLGLGTLLGPISQSIDTVLNQIIDAGTLSNTAGGFLGRGVKFKSGDNSFKPFEWKRVDSTGDNLQNSILPLPVREPSMVLFQTLGMLINYGERVGMATDPQVGISPGQNTPAETSRNTIAEGQKVFNAIFKRVYRALKEEFRKLYALNALYLNETEIYTNLTTGEPGLVLQKDFFEVDKTVFPAADPGMITKEDQLRKALLLREAAASSGMYNKYIVEKRFIEALGIEDVESVLPDPQGPNAIPVPPDTKVVIETMKIEQKNQEMRLEMQFKMFDLMQEIEYLRAEIVSKEASATLMLAQAEGISAGHQIAAIQSAVALAKQKQDGLIAALGVLRDLAGFQEEKKGLVDGIKAGVGGLEESPDDQGVVQSSGDDGAEVEGGMGS